MNNINVMLVKKINQSKLVRGFLVEETIVYILGIPVYKSIIEPFRSQSEI